MFGQDQLVSQFNKYTLANFPCALLLGEDGCGKRTLATEIITKFGLQQDFVEIDSDITDELILTYQQYPTDRFYLVNLSNFTEKAQNKLLKFIEEPSSTVHLILYAESEVGILTTILNRCIKFKFEPYTIAHLKHFKPDLDETIYKICNTPGQILTADSKTILKAQEISKLIISKITAANYANFVSIMTKINYKEEYDKIDFKMFFKVLCYEAQQNYILTNNRQSLNIYLFTVKYLQKLIVKTITKEAFMINFLSSLWQELNVGGNK